MRLYPSERLARRVNILAFIVGYMTEHAGQAPTVREITEACGISSTSVTYYHLRRLEREGAIVLPGARQTRGIRVVGGEWHYRGDGAPRDDRVSVETPAQEETCPP